VQYSGLVPLLAVLWWGRVEDLRLEFASYGVGPMSYVYKAANPQRFAKDFPGGVEQFRASAPMHIYRLAYAVLGIEPEQVFPVFVAFEIVLMSVAMIALTRALRPSAPPIVAALAAAWVVASGARDMNLASFAQPFFWGLYYNVADGLRLFAIVAMLRGRVVLSAALLAGSFMSHPAMGLMGGVFVLAALLAKPRELLARRNLSAGLVFLALVGFWGIAVLGSEPVSGGRFPAQVWFDLTRLNSYHWYPVAKGMFTTYHSAALVPFLSFLVLLAYYLTRSWPLGEGDRKISLGAAAMLLLVVLGVVFSVLQTSPALVKLSLHRANDLVLAVGIVYVAAGLWAEVESGRVWRGIIAGLVLASPFLGPPGFPVLGSALLAAPACRSIGRRTLRPGDAAVVLLLAVALGAVAFYANAGMAAPVDSDAYTGLAWWLRPPVLAGALVFSVALAVRRWAGTAIPRALAIGLLAASAGVWTTNFRLGEAAAAWCREYKSAQLWARENTPANALFLVDPTIYYGWRDYSRRSSFGNLREWLYTSWCYSSDYEHCQEGLRRVAAFGIDVDGYLRWRPPLAGFHALSEELGRRFSTATDELRLDLASRYGIDYMVIGRGPGVRPTRLPVVYENRSFLIVALRPSADARSAEPLAPGGAGLN